MIESAADLRAWLKENHSKNESVWLVKWKKETNRPFVSYDEIVDQCICFGWVDSLPRKLDNERTMLRISPRNPKSNWSKLNKERVKTLQAAGLMHPSGLKMVELAKQTGTWDFLDDVENLLVPDDLAEELKKYKKAAYYFERFPPSSKRGILEWIKMAKTEKTRQKRIVETATKAAENIKANYPKGRDAGPPDN
ncbi:MAG: YdeI/OmpD-associated family protein [Anaerolineales bacterium]|nr:YdeI/OmpD-associated family protein [Anaerolineales bacterium]